MKSIGEDRNMSTSSKRNRSLSYWDSSVLPSDSLPSQIPISDNTVHRGEKDIRIRSRTQSSQTHGHSSATSLGENTQVDTSGHKQRGDGESSSNSTTVANDVSLINTSLLSREATLSPSPLYNGTFPNKMEQSRANTLNAQSLTNSLKSSTSDLSRPSSRNSGPLKDNTKSSSASAQQANTESGFRLNSTNEIPRQGKQLSRTKSESIAGYIKQDPRTDEMSEPRENGKTRRSSLDVRGDFGAKVVGSGEDGKVTSRVASPDFKGYKDTGTLKDQSIDHKKEVGTKTSRLSANADPTGQDKRSSSGLKSSTGLQNPNTMTKGHTQPPNPQSNPTLPINSKSNDSSMPSRLHNNLDMSAWNSSVPNRIAKSTPTSPGNIEQASKGKETRPTTKLGMKPLLPSDTITELSRQAPNTSPSFQQTKALPSTNFAQTKSEVLARVAPNHGSSDIVDPAPRSDSKRPSYDTAIASRSISPSFPSSPSSPSSLSNISSLSTLSSLSSHVSTYDYLGSSSSSSSFAPTSAPLSSYSFDGEERLPLDEDELDSYRRKVKNSSKRGQRVDQNGLKYLQFQLAKAGI